MSTDSDETAPIPLDDDSFGWERLNPPACTRCNAPIGEHKDVVAIDLVSGPNGRRRHYMLCPPCLVAFWEFLGLKDDEPTSEL